MREATIVRQSGEVVCARCAVADTFATRLRGLLGRASLAPDEGMLFRPAGSIHTFFMRFPIDVVLLDRDGAVVAVFAELRPWRAVWHRRARTALELPPGRCRELGLEVGDVLSEKPRA
jgi:uncharacterized membrane protein (UPF0127 family)